MDWPTAMVAATVGGGFVAVVREIFSKKSKDSQDKSLEHVLVTSLQQDCQERRDLLRQLVQAQDNTALSLREMTMLNKHRETRTEEMHRMTHAKLEEITAHQHKYTENQETIIDQIRDVAKDLRRAA